MIENKEPVLVKGASFVDDRGVLRFVNDFSSFNYIKRFYQVENHDINYIRAWHGHKNEGKFVYVPSGVALIGLAKLEDRDKGIECVKKYTMSSENPSILWIPSGYYNGFKNLKQNTIILFFSTSTTEESKGDDIRLRYDHWNIWEEDYR